MKSRSKYRYRRHKSKNRALPKVLLKIGAGLLGTALLSLFFVFCHDAITQSRHFTLREISITGADRISETFRTKKEANEFAAKVEANFGKWSKLLGAELKRHTLGELLDRFMDQWPGKDASVLTWRKLAWPSAALGQ